MTSEIKNLKIEKQRTLGLNRQTSLVSTNNHGLSKMESDFLYHLGLTKEDATKFEDTRYLIIGGTGERMQKLAVKISDTLEVDCESVGEHKRYVLFKCGPVLVCSHGMGGPSISILLHELAKLLQYAGADCVWIRIGTSGGLGLSPGTLCLTEESLNGALEPWHETIVLGERIRRPTKLNQELSQELLRTCADLGIEARVGKTMCCDDFYEGQARLDGAICEYDEQQKLQFLNKAQQAGVINIEMESLQFSAFCNRMNVQSAVMAVAIVDRLDGDQVTSTSEQLAEFESRPITAVIQYVKNDYSTWLKQTSSASSGQNSPLF